jgi:hypothetical protein
VSSLNRLPSDNDGPSAQAEPATTETPARPERFASRPVRIAPRTPVRVPDADPPPSGGWERPVIVPATPTSRLAAARSAARRTRKPVETLPEPATERSSEPTPGQAETGRGRRPRAVVTALGAAAAVGLVVTGSVALTGGGQDHDATPVAGAPVDRDTGTTSRSAERTPTGTTPAPSSSTTPAGSADAGEPSQAAAPVAPKRDEAPAPAAPAPAAPAPAAPAEEPAPAPAADAGSTSPAPGSTGASTPAPSPSTSSSSTPSDPPASSTPAPSTTDPGDDDESDPTRPPTDPPTCILFICP